MGGRLEESRLRLIQPSLAGAWAELDKKSAMSTQRQIIGASIIEEEEKYYIFTCHGLLFEHTDGMYNQNVIVWFIQFYELTDGNSYSLSSVKM